jgi:antitoxin (DNA-binding transcriptional repressor) of toxin-antitoxin stability system
MAAVQFHAQVKDGRIELPPWVAIDDGTEVTVTVPEVPAARPLMPIEQHPAIGMWAEREDMADSAEWVRAERERWRDRPSRRD